MRLYKRNKAQVFPELPQKNPKEGFSFYTGYLSGSEMEGLKKSFWAKCYQSFS
jgi:hypothetical protein